MNAEALDIVNRVVQRIYLLLASIARTCIYLSNRQRPSKQILDCRFDSLAGFLGAGATGGRLQLGVAAIGAKRVFGRKNQVPAIRYRKLELLSHANRVFLPSAGGSLLAFTAKNAAAVIHGDFANTISITDSDGPCGACVSRGTRVAPCVEVELRAPAKLLSQVRREARIISGGSAYAERLLEDLEHRVTDPFPNRTS